MRLRAANPALQLIICLTADNGQPPAPDWEQLDKLDFDLICTLPELPHCLRALSTGKFYRSSVLPPLTKMSFVAPLLGFTDLTHAQRRVLKAICELKTGPQMAESLFLSPKTVNNHRYEIAHKLQVSGGPGCLTRFVASHREQLVQLLAQAENG